MHAIRHSLLSLATLSFIVLLVIAAPVVAADDTTEVTLTGQVVCTACWAEQDDRIAHPYGTDGDMKCAARCSTRNVTQSVAVWSNGKAELVVLERGAFEMKDKDFLAFVAKEVEVRGTVRTDGGKRILKVNALRVVAERPAPKG
jgi:hypothetical protein